MHLICFLSGSYHGGFLKEKAHERMVAAGVVPNLLTWGTVMGGYFRPADKEKLVERMLASGVLPNVHTMITICVSYPEFTDRLRVFRRMSTGEHAVKVSMTAVSKLFENAIFPDDTCIVLDVARGFPDDLLCSHITLGQLLPICADNDDSVLLRRLWWIGAEGLADSKLGWPGFLKQKFSVLARINKIMPANTEWVTIKGATGTFSTSINGTYDRTIDNGLEFYISRSNNSTIIEHFEDKWRVKPASTKGQGKCYAWVAGACPLEDCAEREWSVLDGDAWTVVITVKILTGRTWSLLKSLLRGGSAVIEIPRKRHRTLKVTNAEAASCMPLSNPIEPPPRVVTAKSVKAESAHFSDFFSRMSHAKALNDQALVMAAQTSSPMTLLATLPPNPVEFERPHVEPFEPKPIALVTFPDPSASTSCNDGACSSRQNIFSFACQIKSRSLQTLGFCHLY